MLSSDYYILMRKHWPRK